MYSKAVYQEPLTEGQLKARADFSRGDIVRKGQIVGIHMATGGSEVLAVVLLRYEPSCDSGGGHKGVRIKAGQAWPKAAQAKGNGSNEAHGAAPLSCMVVHCL